MKYNNIVFYLLVFNFIIINSAFSQKPNSLEGDDILFGDRKFLLEGRSWNDRYMTYIFLNGTDDIIGTQEHDEVRTAMSKWAAVADIDFIEVCNENDADIRVAWEIGDHGDIDFDGLGGNLAHAFYPPPNNGAIAGDIHFDDAENWSLDGDPTFGGDKDMLSMALHELGHSLGILHSDVAGAVVTDFYQKKRDLHPDDIAAITTLYGNRDNPITGVETFCSNQANYTLDDFSALQNSISVTWSVTGGLSLVSGQGTGNITVSDNSTSSVGNISVSINSGCDVLNFSREICVGKPHAPTTSPSGAPTIQMCVGEILSVYVTDLACGDANSISWSSTGSISELSPCGSSLNCVYEAMNTGFGNFYVSTSNQCGQSINGGGAVNVSQCNGGGAFRMTPNPTNGVVIVDLPQTFYDERELKRITISDRYSNVILVKELIGNNISLDMSTVENGVYYVNILYQGEIFSSVLVKI